MLFFSLIGDDSFCSILILSSCLYVISFFFFFPQKAFSFLHSNPCTTSYGSPHIIDFLLCFYIILISLLFIGCSSQNSYTIQKGPCTEPFLESLEKAKSPNPTICTTFKTSSLFFETFRCFNTSIMNSSCKSNPSYSLNSTWKH